MLEHAQQMQGLTDQEKFLFITEFDKEKKSATTGQLMALLLGGIGAALGIVMAIILCMLQLKFKLIKIGGGSFLIDYYPVQLVATDFLLVAATAAVIAFVASLFPARKAAAQAFELR